MGRRSILSLSGLDWITRFVCVKTSGCGLILLTITKSSHSGPQSRSLAGQESFALSPNLAIDSTQFLALLSTPAFPDTSENIFEGARRRNSAWRGASAGGYAAGRRPTVWVYPGPVWEVQKTREGKIGNIQRKE